MTDKVWFSAVASLVANNWNSSSIALTMKYVLLLPMFCILLKHEKSVKILKVRLINELKVSAVVFKLLSYF